MGGSVYRLLCLGAVVFLSACQTTNVISYRAEAPADPGVLPEINRNVEVWQDKTLYSHAPRCAVVWPVEDMAQSNEQMSVATWQRLEIERAVARYARDSMDQIIDPLQREAYAQVQKLDLSGAPDRQTLARLLRCKYAFVIRPVQVSEDYALIWSRNRVGFEVALVTAVQPDEVVWSARHVTQRANGSLPLSAVGTALALVEAGTLNSDSQDVFISLANTVARRVFSTMPDLRTPLFRKGTQR